MAERRLRGPLPRELGSGPYLWLAYLAIIPVSLVLGRASWQLWAVQMAGIAAFLPLYVASFRMCGTKKLIPAFGKFLLGALLVGSDAGAMAYFIYAAATLGYAFEPRRAYVALGILLAAIVAALALARVDSYTWLPALLFSGVIGAANIGTAQSTRVNAALLRANEDVERLAKMAERERIARDLHDVLGHTLSVIALKSQVAARMAERDIAQAVAEIRDVESIARTALTELRETVSGYRSAGLPAEVDRARFVLASAGVAVECDVADIALGAIEENVLALALREAVTNVVRHAHAGLCRVRLSTAGRTCTLEVADDGTTASRDEGAGLRGMRERVEAVGGTFVRDFSAGTRLLVSVPLPDRA